MRNIPKLLDAFGIPENIKGYQYIIFAEKLAEKNPLIVHSLLKELYPAIAKEFGTTATAVEHAIKNAIKVSYESGKMRDKMPSSEFIAMISDKNIDISKVVVQCETKQIDVVNELERPIGKIITVIKAHKTGAWHKAVGLYIVNDRNQVLLQKRSKLKKQYPGLWDATCGGHVKAGETAVECAIREAHDHLGINLTPDDVEFIGNAKSVDINSHQWDRHFNKHFVAFKNVDLKKLRLLEHEVDAAKWVDFHVFKEGVTRRDKRLAPRWHAHNAFVKYIEHKHIINHDLQSNKGA